MIAKLTLNISGVRTTADPKWTLQHPTIGRKKLNLPLSEKSKREIVMTIARDN